MPVDVVSVSGGKDSTALYLFAIERGRPFQAVFADTGHENQITIDYVRDLPAKTGGPPIRIVRADYTDKFKRKRQTIRTKWRDEGVPEDQIESALECCRPTGNPFLDSCLLQAGFPATRGRFCTRMLKIDPIHQQVYSPIWATGAGVVNWQGIRREESIARRDVLVWQQLESPKGTRLVAYRPLADWSLPDIWRMHKRHQIEPNPLYSAGMSRVGCFPCIYARKGDLAVLAEKYPDEVERIEKWERLVSGASKRGTSTLFPAKNLKLPGPIRTETHGIRAALDWAKTTRGGHQKLLFAAPEDRTNLLESDVGTACSEWGVCE